MAEAWVVGRWGGRGAGAINAVWLVRLPLPPPLTGCAVLCSTGAFSRRGEQRQWDRRGGGARGAADRGEGWWEGGWVGGGRGGQSLVA